jgi:hypothetical protein
MALEDLLQRAAKHGITHLSLVPVPSVDGKTTYWHATATPSTAHKYVNCNHTDPVIALTGVLEAMPKAPLRAAKAARDKEITAAVTEPAAPARPGEPEPEAVPEPAPSAPPLNLEEEFSQWLPKP